MDLKKFENVQMMWKPMQDRGERFEKFINIIEQKYKVTINDYWELHKWSIENIAEFWSEVWDFSKIIHSKRFDQVVDLTIPMNKAPRWFVGARLNIAENLLKIRDNKIAIIATGEDREKKVITYADMYEEAKIYAAAFRKHGIKLGDRIACYMSNREEALFTMLAAISIGAIFVGELPMLGPQAVLDRIAQINPKVLVASDRFRYSGHEFDMFPKLKVIANGLPNLEKLIIVPSKPDSIEKDISDIPKSCFLKEFLEFAREDDGSIPEMVFEQVPFSQPVFISHTSGTTGVPKAIIHDCGCFLSMARDQYIYGNAVRDNTILAVSPVGWVSWNLSAMHVNIGSKAVQYDGVPYFLTPTYLWDLIDEFEINSFFVTPGTLDDLEKREYVPTEKHKLTSLRFIYAGASVIKQQNFDFVYNKIKKGIIFTSAYGSTEVMGSCMTIHRSLPIYRGEIPCPSLGVDLQCLDDSGNHVLGEMGEIVIAKPIPSLLIGLWGDTDGSKFRETYFSKYPSKFSVGDIGMVNPVTKGIIILCRSDEVLKPFGCRFGSSEIYKVVNKFPEILDSICVSQYSNNGTERAALFLKLRKGYKFDDKLLKKVRDTIKEELTEEHIPGLIMEVPDIPYNINGKKMEILVKKIINKMKYKPDVVMNKDCLKYFLEVPPYIE